MDKRFHPRARGVGVGVKRLPMNGRVSPARARSRQICFDEFNRTKKVHFTRARGVDLSTTATSKSISVSPTRAGSRGVNLSNFGIFHSFTHARGE